MPLVLLASSESAAGAVAQMGERMTGSHEVRGSIPLSSTWKINELEELVPLFLILWDTPGTLHDNTSQHHPSFSRTICPGSLWNTSMTRERIACAAGVP